MTMMAEDGGPNPIVLGAEVKSGIPKPTASSDALMTMETAINGILDHLKAVPKDWSLWNRLASLYCQAGLPELATDALIEAWTLQSHESITNWTNAQLLRKIVPHYDRIPSIHKA